MNYRHSFHAGNFADLVKHALLLDLMARLQQDRPLTVIDTHAGRGLYDLSGDGARSREAEAGIARLMSADALPPELARLADAVRTRNAGDTVRWYPGSPVLVAERLRPGDAYRGFELRPEEAEALTATLALWSAAAASEADGYEAAPGVLPTDGSVLVLIDPPFERPDDYRRAVEAARAIRSRRPDAVIAIWLPIKDAETLDAFVRGLEAARLTGLMAECRLRPLANPMKMNGCAVALIGAPHGAETSARSIVEWVATTLGEPGGRGEVWGF
ncbi:23S rRNA (adenine(2030)-N(6))-methyltransferase RlmJ [Brevundimonas sp.]|uniref:23S rRNA (adenine(2030)-N(6))-methyltransferase RlmJ n=1 Tax=Brevundimonas sp. TaxID=1871086 RepID=UPI0035B3BF96